MSANIFENFNIYYLNLQVSLYLIIPKVLSINSQQYLSNNGAILFDENIYSSI